MVADLNDPNSNRVVPLSPDTTPLSVVSPTAVDSLNDHVLALITVPLGGLIIVAVLSLVVTVLARRYRSSFPVANQTMRYIASDPDDIAGRDGWESELLDDADPPFVRDNQRPIIRSPISSQASLQLQT